MKHNNLMTVGNVTYKTECNIYYLTCTTFYIILLVLHVILYDWCFLLHSVYISLIYFYLCGIIVV